MKITAAICLLAVVPLSGFAQEGAGADPMKEYMEKFGAPGPEHKLLAKHAGTWKADGKMWMAPGAPPTVTTGEAVVRLIFGGRYMTETYKAEMPPLGEFTGRGLTGFDRVEGEFVGTWCDSMSTAIMISRGKLSEDGKAIVTHSDKIKDCMTGKMMTYRMVSEIGDGKTRKFEMFATAEGEKERKIMEINYTRTGDAPA